MYYTIKYSLTIGNFLLILAPSTLVAIIFSTTVPGSLVNKCLMASGQLWTDNDPKIILKMSNHSLVTTWAKKPQQEID